MDQSQKSRLKALVNKAFHGYCAERAEKMIWMRLAPRHNVFKENEASEADDGNLSSKRMRFSAEEMSGTGREEENYQAKRSGQEDAGSAGEALVSERALALEIVLPPKRAIQVGEEIAEVDNAVIEEFNQCMEWIFSKEPLSDYHKAFTGLSNNRGDFPSKAHFSEGVGYLRRCLLPAMQKRIHQGKTPPCDPAHLNQLKACAAGVRDELGIITTRFEGQSHFQSYLDGAIRSNVNYYNRLFGIPSGLEVHALVPAVTSMMGMPFTGVPPYDAHLMNWSPRQYRWIAESVACALISNGERVREVLIMPIFKFFPQVLRNGAPGITLNGTQAQFDMAQMGPAHDFYFCLKLLNESTLLAKELDICEFLQKHLGLSELPQAEDILTIDTEMVINKFKFDLEMLFSSWYIKQQDIPQHKFIHFISELLWRYLVDEESQEFKIAIDNL